MIKNKFNCYYTDSSFEDQESTVSLTINMGSSAKHDWKSYIDCLEIYCQERGWAVEFSKEKAHEAFPAKNLIVLNTRHKPEILYYFFLHELGHMLMVFDDPNYLTKYKVLLERTNGSQTFRVGRVEEEIEAWNKGREFAKSLGLPINESKFEELKASMVGSYMLWAMHRKHPYEYFNRSKFISGICENEE